MRAELTDVFSAMRKDLGPDVFDSKRFHLLGTSGTLTTLAGIKLGLRRYERSRIDGQWLKRDDVLRISDTIVNQDFPGRATIPCIGTDRADRAEWAMRDSNPRPLPCEGSALTD